jgi:kynurenine 3-monooxygenase
MGIRNQRFNFKKQLEQHLMQRYPDRYVSKHVLVMFSNTPYATALAHGRLQSTLLDQICDQTTQLADVDWLRVDELMREYDNALAHTHDKTETA